MVKWQPSILPSRKGAPRKFPVRGLQADFGICQLVVDLLALTIIERQLDQPLLSGIDVEDQGHKVLMGFDLSQK
jgi:hypothetical protein